MYVVKHGNAKRNNLEFKFECKFCGCEWFSWITEDEVEISRTLVNHARMHCPECRRYTQWTDWTKSVKGGD